MGYCDYKIVGHNIKLGGITMSYKISNITLTGILTFVGGESIQFNNEGVGTINSKEAYEALLQLPNFKPIKDENENDNDKGKVEDPPNPEADSTDDKGTKDPEADSIPELVSENMSHNELNAKAEELGIKVDGNKDEKVKAINDYITSNY